MNRASTPGVNGVTADAEVSAEQGYLHSVSLTGDGTNAATATWYNGAIAGADVIARLALPAAGLCHASMALPAPTVFTTLRVVVTGTGAEAIAYYGR